MTVGGRLEIVDGGPLTTVQDLGRPGHAAIGIGGAGAADRGSHSLANRLVGNPAGAATLEVLLGGLTFTACSPIRSVNHAPSAINARHTTNSRSDNSPRPSMPVAHRANNGRTAPNVTAA